MEESPVRAEIFSLIGEINSNFSSYFKNSKIQFIENFNEKELIHLYSIADVLIDCSLRDVTPVAAMDFLNITEDGALLLSEFSGSAELLNEYCELVNPWDLTGFSEAIDRSLRLDGKLKNENIEKFKIKFHGFSKFNFYSNLLNLLIHTD